MLILFRVILIVITICTFIISNNTAIGQINPPPLPIGSRTAQSNPFDNDTLKTKQKQWHNPPAKVYYTKLDYEKKLTMDTSITLIHRLDYEKKLGNRHLGNLGTPIVPLNFDINDAVGPKLGYDHYEDYSYVLLDLPYFNTTRPYSLFRYSLGSKQEQVASLLHTQNINRNWNVALQLKNINSPGTFQNQKSSAIQGFLTSNFSSENKRYKANLGLAHNKFKHDESGGILSDSLLTDTRFVQRSQIPTVIPELTMGRSIITNQNRSFDLILDQHYSWGTLDTLYNSDSTAIIPRFTPKFRLRNQIIIGSQKHYFVDKFPEYDRYTKASDPFDINANDSLKNNQKWYKLEDKFSINGFVEKPGKQLKAEAGIGIRLDRFIEKIDSTTSAQTFYNNYLFGTLQKEALDSNQWEFRADGTFYFLGSSTGDFIIKGNLFKQILSIGSIELQAKQSLTTAPYAMQHFATNYFVRDYNFTKQSHTLLGGNIYLNKLKLEVGIKSHLLKQYIYLNPDWQYQQLNEVFSVLQFFGHHTLKWRYLRLNTEAVFQKATGNAPIAIPPLILRSIIAYENKIIKDRLNFVTGIDISYHTPFMPYGYNPFLNQFYYQNTERINNPLVLGAFLNFKVKRLRLFVAGDQLQQLVIKENAMSIAHYPLHNAMIRFGFYWELMN